MADGAEAVVQGHITDRWDILSSYTFLHAEVVSSESYPNAFGKPLNNVPENLFNLRTLLFDLDNVAQRISAGDPNSTNAVKLTGIYHNLLRRWAEV